ncbi:MAG TPA: Lrp/AsnC family transcriptional regulator [Porticoccus sp.]|nr:Lrp/AsnC family transcriptional regulator [Porticoccus sp.]
MKTPHMKAPHLNTRHLKELDNRLIELLRANSRESIANLSRKLGVSRATVKEHMETLERRKVIQGYTIRFHPEHEQCQLNAYVMICADPRLMPSIVHQIKQLPSVESLQTISGIYDLMTLIICESTLQLDQVIDKITEIEGVEKTLTSIILASKFQR